eukprot:TRINITY_DN827_c0_g2_i1.p1 TRINITY_DN827_c0_g2~~TRINITY_DN827_c0_g2_i1.p1  ORF type:complete len:209 (-),score=59.52 TRINITY_DN827_c0_g2_i1:940-1566(-)
MDHAAGLMDKLVNLERVRLQGRSVALNVLNLQHLDFLRIETPGLRQDTLVNIGKSDLPNLRVLQLFLGSPMYGASWFEEDLLGILKPLKKYRKEGNNSPFPKLEVLGLMNCHAIEPVIPLITNSIILRQLKELDLSAGCLCADSMDDLIRFQGNMPNMEIIRLDANYLRYEDIKRLKTAWGSVKISGTGQREDYGFGERNILYTGDDW